MGKLRESGVDDPARVKAAYMESDGAISVISGTNARSARVFSSDPAGRCTALMLLTFPGGQTCNDPAASSPAGCNAIPIAAAMDMQSKFYRRDGKACRCSPPAEHGAPGSLSRRAPVDGERRPLLSH